MIIFTKRMALELIARRVLPWAIVAVGLAVLMYLASR
jgi:hypothetical protein